MAAKPLPELAERLGYSFKNPKLLETACIHKSYGNEFRAGDPLDVRNNERLEFLGDAILDLILSQMLLESSPEASEGDLSKIRAGFVNERTLAKLARELELGQYLRLGKGEDQTGGRDKDSILASTLEAVFAAVFLDGGFEGASELIRRLFSERVASFGGIQELEDFKTRLQEIIQARYRTAPRYELVESTGPDHDKTFCVSLMVNGRVIATAYGKSKKEAEQSAAKSAFEQYGPQIDL